MEHLVDFHIVFYIRWCNNYSNTRNVCFKAIHVAIAEQHLLNFLCIYVLSNKTLIQLDLMYLSFKSVKLITAYQCFKRRCDGSETF